MKQIISTLIVFLAIFCTKAQKAYKSGSGKYGFKASNGKVIIPAKYDMALEFSNGLAAVNYGLKKDEDGETIEDGKWGFIDKIGNEVIKFKYDLVKDFDKFGFAIVINTFKDSSLHLKYGVINRSGKEVLPLIYDYIDNWGIAQINSSKGIKKGYFDPSTLKEIIPVKYDDIHLYECGIATVMQNGKYGFVDQLTGKEIVSPKYDSDFNNSFSEGLAKVSLSDKYFYVDDLGNEFDTLDYIKSYKVDEYRIVILSSQPFFIDSTGKKYVTAKKFSRVYDIFKDVAWVNFNDGGMGIIDIKSGKDLYTCYNCDGGSLLFSSDGVISLDYPTRMFIDINGIEYFAPQNTLESFKNENGKYGFYKYTMSKKSDTMLVGFDFYKREILPAKYDTIYQVAIFGDWGEGTGDVSNEGFHYVGIGGKRGLIDSTGKEITPIKYDWIANSFLGGEYAKVGLNGKMGLIDISGREVISPTYYEIETFSEGLASVQLKQGGDFGYIDTNGKLVIDTILSYESVGRFSEGLAIVKGASIIADLEGNRQTLYGYIDKTGKEIIPLKYTLADDFKNGKAKVKLTVISSNYEEKSTEFYIDKNGSEIK